MRAELSRADVERSPFVELLPLSFGGATQVIGAAAADPDDAAVLDIPVGSPVLRVERVTRDDRGSAVLVAGVGGLGATVSQLLVTWQSSQVLELAIWLTGLPGAVPPLWQE